jgi:hypothetical protein
MDGTAGISSWRWIFILEGIFNICVALCTFFILPRFPTEFTFLLPKKKKHLLDRLSLEGGDEAERFKDQPCFSFIFDWQTWLNIVIYFGADMSAAAIFQFSPTILKQMGYKSNAANLRNITIWLVGALITISAKFAAGKWGIRFPLICTGATLCTIGWSLQLAQVNLTGIRYFSLYLIAIGAFTQFPLLVSWLSANTNGRPRKAVAHALQVSFGNSANFASANVFITKEAPKYHTGFTARLCITVIGFAAACVMELVLWRKNRGANEREKRDKVETEMVGKDGMRFWYTL